MTIQLNFGHVDSTVAARFEFLAMTGTDDGSDLPDEIIEIIKSPTSPTAPTAPGSAASSSPRTPEQQQELREYFSTYSEFTKRDRVALANLQERLDAITKKFPTMVMDVSPQPRDTHILNRGDYSQPKEKVTAGTPSYSPPTATRRGTGQPPRPRPVDDHARPSPHRPRRSKPRLANPLRHRPRRHRRRLLALKASTQATPNCSTG